MQLNDEAIDCQFVEGTLPSVPVMPAKEEYIWPPFTTAKILFKPSLDTTTDCQFVEGALSVVHVPPELGDV